MFIILSIKYLVIYQIYCNYYYNGYYGIFDNYYYYAFIKHIMYFCLTNGCNVIAIMGSAMVDCSRSSCTKTVSTPWCCHWSKSCRDKLYTVQESTKNISVAHDGNCYYWFRYARGYWNCYIVLPFVK